ncbi:MAG: VCBS repeat-containing protein [Planctomycetes bacterium]|nr:VCBS repeat-containing protein [Planctomycetota bacterium]
MATLMALAAAGPQFAFADDTDCARSLFHGPAAVAGYGTRDLAAGDVNGDGHPDLVSSNWNAMTASVLLNDGQGRFEPEVSYPMGQSYGLRLGDLNGDGDLDLLMLDNTELFTLDVRLNLGDGTFGPRTSYACGGTPRTFDLGDLDGDGDIDVAVTRADTFATLRNNGDGTFAPLETIPSVTNLWPITIADIDGDGDEDVIACRLQTSATLAVFMNDGTASFTLLTEYPVQNAPFDVITADLEGDGDRDVIVSNGFGTSLPVFRNDGNGSFTPGSVSTFVPAAGGLGVADLNSDGLLDLVMGVGDIHIAFAADESGFHPAQEQGAGIFYSRIATADFDKDGSIDVAGATGAGSVAVFATKDDGTLVVSARYELGDLLLRIAAEDMNGDGYNDLVVVGGFDDAINVMLNTGAGTFADPLVHVIEPSLDRELVLGDFNQDGVMDAAVDGPSVADVAVTFGNGDGTFDQAISYDVDGVTAMIGVDLDGDDALELVTSSSYLSTATVLMNAGDGTFTVAPALPVRDSPRGLAAADADGDGDTDVIIASYERKHLQWLINDGNGEFTVIPHQNAADKPRLPVFADLDGDGVADLVTANYEEAALTVRRGDGSGGWTATHTLAVPGIQFNELAIADIDHDRHLDIVIVDGAGQVIVIPGRGDGTFGVSHGYAAIPGVSLVVADLDGQDGLDFATANWDDGTLTVGLNRCPGVACDADLDRDGRVGFADVLALLCVWGECVDACSADLDDSGTVDGGDLFLLLGAWGECE